MSHSKEDIMSIVCCLFPICCSMVLNIICRCFTSAAASLRGCRFSLRLMFAWIMLHRLQQVP